MQHFFPFKWLCYTKFVLREVEYRGIDSISLQLEAIRAIEMSDAMEIVNGTSMGGGMYAGPRKCMSSKVQPVKVSVSAGFGPYKLWRAQRL